MKEWYYTTSDDIDKKYYFNSYADTVFEILYVYRYRAAKKMFRIIMYIAMTS